MTDVVVIGAGPAGAMAALRAANLGARTTLVTSGAFGGMAGNDGPVPVRTLAHAARLLREARQLGAYGIQVSEPVLAYPKLLGRVAEVVQKAARNSTFRPEVEAAGVTVCEHEGPARFVDAHTIETATGRRVAADKVILCIGGVSRRLPVPGFDLTATHSDAWSLPSVPPSMLVIGSGRQGLLAGWWWWLRRPVLPAVLLHVALPLSALCIALLVTGLARLLCGSRGRTSVAAVVPPLHAVGLRIGTCCEGQTGCGENGYRAQNP